MGWLEDGQRLFVCNPHRWFMWPPYDVLCTISKPQTPVHIQCCVYLYGFRAYFLLRLLCAALLNSHFVCMQIGERFVRVCGTHVEPSSGVIYSLTRSRHYACRGSRPLVVGDSLSVLAVLACIRSLLSIVYGHLDIKIRCLGHDSAPDLPLTQMKFRTHLSLFLSLRD